MVKAIFHIDDYSRWSLLLGNVKNLTRVLEPSEYHVKVLANSEAVKLYADKTEIKIQRLIENLSQTGIRFMACNNSLNALGIEREILPGFVEIVPVGVLELIERQAEGYAYIKP